MDKPYWYTKQHDFLVRQSVREMACSFFCHQGFIGIIWAHSLLESIRSDEGLTLETSAFLNFHGGNSTFINSFDETKFLLESAQLNCYYRLEKY